MQLLRILGAGTDRVEACRWSRDRPRHRDAHHEEPQVAAHLLAAVAHGTYAECLHPDPDPLFWNLSADPSHRSEAPVARCPESVGLGLGLVLDVDYIARYRIDR